MALTVFLWCWIFNGFSTGNHWSPGLRQDISGMDVIPGQDLLIVANDRGYLTGIMRYARPIVSILDPNALLPATPIMIKGTEALLDKNIRRWDAEAVKCRQDQLTGIICIVVSEKNHQAILISAPSPEDTKKGNFKLSCVMDFKIKDDINDKEYSSQQLFESVKWFENIYPSNVDLANSIKPLSIVMIGQDPENITDGKTKFQKYRLDIPPYCEHGSHQVVYLKKLPSLSIDLCRYVPHSGCSTPHLSEITSVGENTTLYLFTRKKLSETILLSLTIESNKFHSQTHSVKFDVLASGSLGLAPNINVKIEGVTCLNGKLWFGLDPDGSGGGVFTANNELSAKYCSEIF